MYNSPICLKEKMDMKSYFKNALLISLLALATLSLFSYLITSLKLAVSRFGDVNDDGIVNMLDLLTIGQFFASRRELRMEP